RVQQPALSRLSALGVYHGNLLKARMKITTYNLHDCSFRPRALWVLNQPQFTWGRGAVVVIESSEAPRKVVPIEDPERVVEGPGRIVPLAAVSGSSSHNLSFYVPGGKRCSPALRCRAKCNSAPIVCEVDSLGEFPVAVWKKDALSGSFDCAPKILA